MGVKAKRWNNKPGQVSLCTLYACLNVCLRVHAGALKTTADTHTHTQKTDRH